MQVRRHLDPQGDGPGREVTPELGVVLLHLGGPTSESDIEPFYRRLWSLPEVAPGLPLLRGRRIDRAWEEASATILRGHQLIGGRSPVCDLARSQALALQNRFCGRPMMAPAAPGSVVARAAFCLAEPTVEQVVDELKETGVERVVALTLYPQASESTTGVCLSRLDGAVKAAGWRAPVSVVESYHDLRPFQRVLADRTRRAIDLVPPELRDETFLLFALHSPPHARAEADRYLAEVERTAQAVMKAVGYDEERSAVAYQTCRPPVRTLAPTVAEFALQRAEAGCRSMVVAPVSYVTDSFESLHDLDIEAFSAATEAGMLQFRRVPSLNADPVFVGALADLVRRSIPADVWTRIASRVVEDAS